jgi:hypothetical protein
MIRLSPKSALALAFDMAMALRGTLEEVAAMEESMQRANDPEGSGKYSVFTPEEIEKQGGLLKF